MNELEIPFGSEETKKLNLKEAIKMLNECGTNINSQYEQQVLDLINKALTPPTKEEVCAALSEYSGLEVFFEGKDFGSGFYYGKHKKDMNGKDYTQKRVIVCMYNGEIGFNTSLPPHLITMIGRFYEKEVNEE